MKKESDKSDKSESIALESTEDRMISALKRSMGTCLSLAQMRLVQRKKPYLSDVSLGLVPFAATFGWEAFSREVWISKFLSHSGVCSRRTVKELILQGGVIG